MKKNKQPPPPYSNGIWTARELRCPAAIESRNLIRKISKVTGDRGLGSSEEADPMSLMKKIPDPYEQIELA